MATSIQRRARANEAYRLMSLTGETCQAIGEVMGVGFQVISKWVNPLLSDGLTISEFRIGVRRRRIEMLRKTFGYSYGKIGERILGCGKDTVYRTLKHKPQGCPVMTGRLTGEISDVYDKQRPTLKPKMIVAVEWLTDELALVTEQARKRSYHARWSHLYGNIQLLGWKGLRAA